MRTVRTLFAALLSVVFALAGVLVPQQASAAPPPAKANHTVTYDGYSFLVDGNRTYLWSGSSTPTACPAPTCGSTSSRR